MTKKQGYDLLIKRITTKLKGYLYPPFRKELMIKEIVEVHRNLLYVVECSDNYKEVSYSLKQNVINALEKDLIV